MQIVAISFP